MIPLEYRDRNISILTLRDLLRFSELGCSFEFLGSQTELVSSHCSFCSGVSECTHPTTQIRKDFVVLLGSVTNKIFMTLHHNE